MKSIEFDENSIESINRCINILSSFKGNLLSSARKQDFNERISAAFEILNSDISSIYSDLVLDEEKKYYLYFHCDPNRNISVGRNALSTFAATLGCRYLPFYVGKGHSNRAYDLNRNETHRKIRQKIKEFDKDIDVFISHHSLTEREALELESKMIDIFGLNGKNGYLVNLDEGHRPFERRKIYIDSFKKLNRYNKNKLYDTN